MLDTWRVRLTYSLSAISTAAAAAAAAAAPFPLSALRMLLLLCKQREMCALKFFVYSSDDDCAALINAAM